MSIFHLNSYTQKTFICFLWLTPTITDIQLFFFCITISLKFLMTEYFLESLGGKNLSDDKQGSSSTTKQLSKNYASRFSIFVYLYGNYRYLKQKIKSWWPLVQLCYHFALDGSNLRKIHDTFPDLPIRLLIADGKGEH